MLKPKCESLSKPTFTSHDNITTPGSMNGCTLKVELVNGSHNNSKIITKPVRNAQISVFRGLLKLMFSNIGLVLIVCLYSCLGAFMFKLLEQHAELQLCEQGKGVYMRKLDTLKDELIRYILYNITNVELAAINQFNGKNFTNSNSSTSNIDRSMVNNIDMLNEIESNQTLTTTAEMEIDEMLRKFRSDILLIDLKYKYNGQDCIENSRWKFFSSLLFSISAITTIGYGHVTPITWEGQLVCICYCTIGIPIFLLCLANLSSAFGDIFKFIFTTLHQFNPLKKLKKTGNSSKSTSKMRFSNMEMLLNLNKGIEGQIADVPEDLILNELNKLYDPNYSEDDETDNEDDDELDDEDPNKVQIPFLLLMFVIVLYTMLGAYLFRYFENWSLVQSAYFVYVSLSTMGFGDYVAGQRVDDLNSNIKMVTVAFYLLFGMAIIGMCFSLAQSVAKRTVRRLISTVKRLLYLSTRKKSGDDDMMSEAEREKEKQEILNRIRFLQNYDSMVANTRRRNV